MNDDLAHCGLRFNPFEPAASGAPLGVDLWIPDRWRTGMRTLLDTLKGSQGVKAIAIKGEYGSGKTYLLRWLEYVELPTRHRMRPYFFDNPGVQFYDLANSLLRQVGRYEFAKMLWEYVSPELPGLQMALFEEGLLSWLRSVTRSKRENEAVAAIASKLRLNGITSDEEISHRLAQVVVGTLDRPFFEYRDFVAGRKDAVVAEKEEAPYFAAIIRILQKTGHAEAVAFLMDEFEEISLQKRLTQKQAYDYLATMKRLINVARDENFWLIVAMTPDSAGKLQQIEPSLWDRFTSQGEYEFQIPPLSLDEASDLVRRRLKVARQDDNQADPDFPFPADFASALRPTTISSPRRLVKVAFYAIAEAQQHPHVPIPFTFQFLREIEAKVYPVPKTEGTEKHHDGPV